MDRKEKFTVVLIVLITLILSVLLWFGVNKLGEGKSGRQKWLWAVLAGLLALILSIGSIYAYRHTSQQPVRKTELLLFFFSVAIGLIAGGIYYAKTYKSTITPDEYSKTRMNEINQVMTSYLGAKWPTVLGIITILLSVIILLLYFQFHQSIEISDKYSGRVYLVLIGILVLLTILTLLQAKSAYDASKEKAQQQSNQDGDFGGSSSDANEELIKYGVLLLMLGVVAWFVYRRFGGIKSSVNSGLNSTV